MYQAGGLAQRDNPHRINSVFCLFVCRCQDEVTCGVGVPPIVAKSISDLESAAGCPALGFETCFFPEFTFGGSEWAFLFIHTASWNFPGVDICGVAELAHEVDFIFGCEGDDKNRVGEGNYSVDAFYSILLHNPIFAYRKPAIFINAARVEFAPRLLFICSHVLIKSST